MSILTSLEIGISESEIEPIEKALDEATTIEDLKEVIHDILSELTYYPRY